MVRELVVAAALVVSLATPVAAQSGAGRAEIDREIALLKEQKSALERKMRRMIEDRVVEGIAAAQQVNDTLAPDAPCGASGPLAEARKTASAILDETRKYRVSPGIHVVIVAAGHWMDVADIIRSRGCTDDARLMYEEVFRRHPEMVYGGLRDRAKVALDGMR